MILSRGDPSLAGDAPALQHVLIAFWLRHTNYRYVAPHQEDFLFSCFLIHSAFGRMSVIARSQVCRLEFRRRICAQYLPATGCSRAMPDSSAHDRRAFQNRDNSAA